MKLFAKGKGPGEPGAQAVAFRPIDRMGLLGLLDQVVNAGQAGVLELREPRGNWIYAFQGGALTHASGGRVRGARQAFDLLWEFQAGEFTFTPGVNPGLAGNLYIDKGRLLDLLRRSQAVLQGPSAPYIPPGQQRPIAPVPRPYSPPSPAQMPPPWQPGQQAQPGWAPTAQPPMPQAPAWGQGYPQQPGYPAPAQQGQPFPAQSYPPSRGRIQPPAPAMPPQAPAYPGFQQQPQMAPPQPAPPQAMPQRPVPQAPPMMPQPAQPPYAPQPPYGPQPPQPPFAAQPPMAPPAPVRPVAPPSFSVPPMAIPRKQVPAYQPPAPQAAPVPEPPKPAQKDDLAALRASLVSQAPQVRPAPSGPAWNVRTADGAVAPPTAPTVKGKGKGKAKGKDKSGAKKADSKLVAGIKVQLIKFLLWACERRYSPDDHWTLKDAFEVSTMELRDQFIGAFSQTLQSSKKTKGVEDDDVDDMTAGRMRGRGRRH